MYLTKTNISNVTIAVTLIAIAIAKLVITSGNEIITEGSDSIEYMLIAADWFWGYKTMPIRGPLFPLYLALVHLSHLPLRLVSEVFFILSASIFSLSLQNIGIPRYLMVVVFTVLVFHPVSISVFDMPMSEGLIVTMLLFNLSFAVLYLTATNIKYKINFAILFGLTTAGLLQTRCNDATLIYLMPIEVILLDIIIFNKRRFNNEVQQWH